MPQESYVLPRKAAAGAERGSLEPGHASLPWAGGPQACRRLGGQPRLTNRERWLLLDTTALRGQLCRTAFLRIASAEAWSFRVARDRGFFLWQLTNAPGIHKWPPGSVGVWAPRAV